MRHLPFVIARSVANTAIGRAFLHRLLRYGWLPVHYHHQTQTLTAFDHPAPSYPVHILIVPRDPIASLIGLDPDRDSLFLHDLFATVQLLVHQLSLEQYRLICNGGAYQEIPHLHFHLIGE